MLDYNMDPQEALDAPRFCITPGNSDQLSHGAIALEEGISLEAISRLKAMGHDVQGPITGHNRAVFGRGQIISSRPVDLEMMSGSTGSQERVNVWWSGSDGRADGMAVGY